MKMEPQRPREPHLGLVSGGGNRKRRRAGSRARMLLTSVPLLPHGAARELDTFTITTISK
jgi:hypothetical protein